MALPSDAYPIATANGQQIRMDMVRPEKLDVVPFSTTAGTIPNLVLVKTNAVYVFLADVDCIVDFVNTATKAPVNASALLIMAGERVTCMLSPDAVSLSVVGLVDSGKLYVQTITNWAGLGYAEALSNG